jgi:aryl-alcohol dehydrogenase-like predicted oxidoreductase
VMDGGLPHRALGASGIEVSILALGSWRTFEEIPREQGVEVMSAARAAGIDLLDDARYNDRSGKAPLRTGYSEVVFGELFRAVGWKRDEVTVSNKLWWEFWPRESAAEELDGSLGRMGFDYLDLVYSERPPDGLEVAGVVAAVAELIAAGKTRAWGVLNWPAEQIAEAARVARAERLPAPCAAQLPYNVALRSPVEDDATVRALDEAHATVVASWGLAGGALTGKYAAATREGRMAGELDRPSLRPALSAAQPLRDLAGRIGATPAPLALAFTLANPRVATVLFGATRPQQVQENVQAATVLAHLGDAELAELRRIGGGEA